MQKIVSLGAVLVGFMLIVGYKNYGCTPWLGPRHLLEYTLVRRVLPIVWVIMAMAIAFATGNAYRPVSIGGQAVLPPPAVLMLLLLTTIMVVPISTLPLNKKRRGSRTSAGGKATKFRGIG